MKPTYLFIPIALIVLSSCIVSNKVVPNNNDKTFNWTDTSFTIGAKRTIKVLYSLDRSHIMDTSRVVLDTVVRFIKHNPKLKIGIYNHTDQQGSPKHNMVLSQSRAQEVVSYLISQGIDSVRLLAKGFGSLQPIIPLDEINKMKTKEEMEVAYRTNRRTEVVILATDYHAIK
jgi:outer membrane protein OmpA-like peptidoglycan-associated protein